MVNYYCPDFYKNLNVYKEIIKLQEDYPHIFYDNVKIKYIFGNFPGCTWNGGAYHGGKQVSRQIIETYFEIYSLLQVKLQLTMTNPLLEECDLYDRYANLILSIANDKWSETCEVLVSTELVENYIRTTYPNLKINRSIVNTKEIDFIEGFKKYHNMVLPIRYNRDFEFLKQFSDDEKSRLEILCSDPCNPNCPVLYEHYKDFARLHLFELEPSEYNNICYSKTLDHKFLEENYEISYQEIIDNYVSRGFSEFKLSGRGNPKKAILTLVQYLIKPEYYFRILDVFLNK